MKNVHDVNLYRPISSICQPRLGAARHTAKYLGLFVLLVVSSIGKLAQAQSFEQVAVGESHVCGLDASGIVQCSTTAITRRLSEPDDIPALQEITAGQQHTCGITLEGGVVCWGANAFNVLDAPEFGAPVETISAGRNHTCGIDVNGRASCWGLNSNGQLNAPDSSFITIGANLTSSCGILTDGDIVCWTTDEKFFTPEPVPGPFTDLDLARNVGCGLTANGDIECFASTFGDSPAPPTNGPYTDLTVTDSSICGLTFDNLLDCSFSQFRDDDDLLAEQFPTDVPFSSIERSAERFTPTPVCGVRADTGEINCFGGNRLPAPPGSSPDTATLIASDIDLTLTALFYSTSSVELFWNSVPTTFPPVLVEVYRDDELLLVTDASFSYLDRESIASGESRYRVRTVDEAGNTGEFSNDIIVDRSTGQVRSVGSSGGDTPPISNPRPDDSLQIENLLLQRLSTGTEFSTGTATLNWNIANPMNVALAGYEIRINNEPSAFVSANETLYLDRSSLLQDCRIYTVAAISTEGEILDFRTAVLNRTSRGRFCPSSN